MLFTVLLIWFIAGNIFKNLFLCNNNSERNLHLDIIAQFKKIFVYQLLQAIQSIVINSVSFLLWNVRLPILKMERNYLLHILPKKSIHFVFAFGDWVSLCSPGFSRTHYVFQIGLQRALFPPQLPKCWGYWHVPPSQRIYFLSFN
jgi:hypothetical protein